ncbi:bifunctional 3-demethylubiquinol 3-O-methyltransferase/2-polyprenyl-6-hydroxyphenol methylase [Kaistia algarum]|uniref:bifunctional 2-polyprenyl-6-hydroxyphenol methylase/3-demethylubiquinol 3-O-methyltransferase UbiG n=1 Tax=Kaistia algarum TaxID=2083279 RepID=UPI000CE8E1CA|nr:bifunctional 2-polyprenyl-6-hydroxyphenol methylase/3-demethylubiquinol 3-O-methyltransferase UbiG [Kaistia algarum]MCX5514490.1 bifunctional 2-polyprenyl-6-hydroxyphenol methylase/3-demethylubiquinol 3-O-methyltransferase UbiG [Kaistia algarum]PPE79217.1 bifunctional 3-demethylubiquinol 3-O-methyltransferase/2-polyprenyl-6-hydroxyphenol methylase [Kaistia algarum]
MPVAIPAHSTVDDREIAHFSAIADEWWAPGGKFAPLHRLNPIRIQFIKDEAGKRFARGSNSARALDGLRVLDIGCGGGLLSEPMARLGAEVIGADASATNIAVASLHANEGGLAIDYRATTAEALAETGETFDIVLAMEIVEHVADLPLFIRETARMVKPGGLMVLSTINRTPKAWLLAIMGAEYILRWLPRGTHSYEKLVKPQELVAALAEAGLELSAEAGVIYDPLRDGWKVSSDMDVNYMIAAARSIGV